MFILLGKVLLENGLLVNQMMGERVIFFVHVVMTSHKSKFFLIILAMCNTGIVLFCRMTLWLSVWKALIVYTYS